MHKIKKIVLKNFKFFYGTKEIDFDRKHVLIYGENGSGKSSVYWALYTFFQSVFKIDPRQVQKYFLPITKSPESIKNRYALDKDDSFIEIHFDDENHDPRIKKISNTTVNTRTDKFVEQITLSSDLIDYKSIFNIYNFTNKDRVKLFRYFEKNLMPFINLNTTLVDLDGKPISKNLSDWWNYLKNGINPYPGIYDKKYTDFQALIAQFNKDLKFYLDSITETANDYLEKKFKENIQISFKDDYEDCTYNDFNKHNKGRNKITVAPEIYLTATLIDSNLDENTHKVNRVHTFLNEAKLSSIALAIRMAILKDKYVKESPKMLILDDLLLSLDMGNREAVLNIVLEEYFEDYQIIFLTHDRVFFQTILSYIKTYHSKKMKAEGEHDTNKLDLAFNNYWKIYEMYESNLPDEKYIPVITEYKSSLQKALHYFSSPEHIDYNACGNNLRAALEEFFIDFIPKEFLKDKNGQPIEKNALTLNPLIEKCIEYFTHLGFDTSILDKLNRYRERALNQTSHYNPHSNYFKKELQATFEIINILNTYRTNSVVQTDELLQFSITCKSGKEYVYTFKPLDDIRLYLESKDGAESFYNENDKRTYALVGYTENDNSLLINHISNNQTLQEFYDETISGLEKKIKEDCNRTANILKTIKNIKGKSLIELKKY
jgi:ABC-type oligopeptide transport system ATPase subunit